MIFKISLVASLVAICFGNAPDTYRIDAKQSLEEYKSPPSPYNFEFNTKDENGTSQFRSETSDGKGKIEGRYGYKDAFGIERIVEYVADENGYRAQIKTNEPGIESKSPASAQFYTNPLPSGYHAAQASKSIAAPVTSSIQHQAFMSHGSSSHQKQEFASAHQAQESHAMKQQHDFKRLSAETTAMKETSAMKAFDSKKPTASTAFFNLGAAEEKKKSQFGDKEHKQASAHQTTHFAQQTASASLSHSSPAESSFVQFASAQSAQPQQQFHQQTTAPQHTAHFVQQAAPAPLSHSSSPAESSFVQFASAQSAQPQQQFHQQTTAPQHTAHFVQQAAPAPLSHSSSPAESSFVQFASAQQTQPQQQFQSTAGQSSFVQLSPAQFSQPQQQFKGTASPHYFPQNGQPLVFFLATQGQQLASQSGPQKGQPEGAQPQFRFQTGFVHQPNAPFTIFQQ